MSSIARTRSFAPLLLVASTSALACVASAEGADVGEVRVAVTTVPAAVRCIEITATGSSTVVRTSDVTGGSSSVNLALGQLPLGDITMTGRAFDVSCSSTAGATPTWIADPQDTTLAAGVPKSMTLTFRPINPVGASASFVGNVAEIALGPMATFVRFSDGTLRYSGYTPSGNSITTKPTTWYAPNLASSPASGGTFFCYLATNGTVQCQGENGLGQLGDGTNNYAWTPVTVSSSAVTNAVQVVAGSQFACALRDGYVYCWGANGSGQLGNGSTVASSTTPVFVLGGVARITAGPSSMYAVMNDGTVKAWGANTNGQLGDATTTPRFSPVSVVGLRGTLSVAAGNGFACALRADGTVRCWGDNSSGQLGDGGTTPHLTPVTAIGVSAVTHLAAGMMTTCVRTSAGSVQCWGGNSLGELGDGTATNRLTPGIVPTTDGATALYGSFGSHFCVQMPDQSIRCWGNNQTGQLGTGTRFDAFTPIEFPL